MQTAYTAVIKQSGNWWTGGIEEVPGDNCQEASREELVPSLQVTPAEAIAFNREDARAAAGAGFEELTIAG